MYQALNDYLEKKSILILGYGREGKSTFEYIRSVFPEKNITIADQRDITAPDENTGLIIGKDYLKSINEYDLVIKSPGISIKDVSINPEVEVTCQLDLFLRFTDTVCIGVTGTKGKTTTSTLIYLMLKASGIKTALIGNIGIPVFEQLPHLKGVTPVIEMSSHQLEFTKSSPHIAVLTNVYPEHLDHYLSFEDYVRAKSHIAIHQTKADYFLFGKHQGVPKEFSEQALLGQQVLVSLEDAKKNPMLNKIMHANDLLKGRHNQFDIALAYYAATLVGAKQEAILAAVQSYEGIPHRMEKVGIYKGITFYNDAIATIPAAVKAALDALMDVETLIIGGMDRGIDYTSFIDDLAASTVKNIVGLPETGFAIGNELERRKVDKCIYLANTMEEAVAFAFTNTSENNICLFSPAASSYNVYRNFEEKGDHFKALVKAYAEK